MADDDDAAIKAGVTLTQIAAARAALKSPAHAPMHGVIRTLFGAELRQRSAPKPQKRVGRIMPPTSATPLYDRLTRARSGAEAIHDLFGG